MYMEIHDNELDDPQGTLCADIGTIDYDYQAEQWVIDTHEDHPKAILWLLFSGDKPEDRVGRDEGCRILTKAWERQPEDTGMPKQLMMIEDWEKRIKYPKEKPETGTTVVGKHRF